MRRYLTLRLLQSLVLLLLVSMIGFAILHLAPGGPMSQFMAGGEMSPEDIARVERQLGLDRPLPVQYLEWLGRMLVGDWGRSYRDQQPVLARLRGQRVEALRDVLGAAPGDDEHGRSRHRGRIAPWPNPVS